MKEEKRKDGLNNDDDFAKALLKQQREFNQLLEKALEIDIDTKFDVKKYLPKNEQYSSKILRKYQGVLNKKEYIAHQGLIMNKKNDDNDVSDIKNDWILGEDNDTTFNYNFMPTHPNKKEDVIEEDGGNRSNNYYHEYNEPYFAVYIEEIEDKRRHDVKNVNQNLRKQKRNDIEVLNDNITKSYVTNNNNEVTLRNKDSHNYMWYCLDYECEGEDRHRKEIEEKFLSFD